MLVNFTDQDKSKAKHNDNYHVCMNLTSMDCSCYDCIFVGEHPNNPHDLCAKHMREIANLESGRILSTCDSAKHRDKWYNQIGLLKKLILRSYGFEFKNR